MDIVAKGRSGTVEIVFRQGRLAKVCSTEADVKRMWGQYAAKVMQRLAELAAAETLADMGTLPPARCHQLVGNRKGQFAVKAGPRLRVVFEPATDPIPRKRDLAKVTMIRVLAIEDYHE